MTRTLNPYEDIGVDRPSSFIASSCSSAACVGPADGMGFRQVLPTGALDGWSPTHAGRIVSPEEQQKAEKKALLLFQNLFGADNCDLYRENHLVKLKPGRFWWIIGDLEKSFDEKHPFNRKPDVARVDNWLKWHITLFCVDQAGSEPTPFTDKVIVFATHLQNDEKAFFRTINRIRETTVKKLPRCAVIGEEGG